MLIPEQLIANCRKMPERQIWLDSLPAVLEELTDRWSLRIDAPYDHANVTCSWVAAVVRADGMQAVLKLGMPHMEGADEIHGLRFWNGEPTVRLLEADDDLGAMLLERCQPGLHASFQAGVQTRCGDRGPAETPLANICFVERHASIQAPIGDVAGLEPGDTGSGSALARRRIGERRIADLAGTRAAFAYRHTSRH
jgi:hypothetical protein